MASASIKLANGTSVQVEGTPDEVAKLLALYGGASPTSPAPTPPTHKKHRASKIHGKPTKTSDAGQEIDLAQIINFVKTCDEAEAIEKKSWTK